jgi:methylated-DNA-[protein]-cysteine S-methyltransferase
LRHYRWQIAKVNFKNNSGASQDAPFLFYPVVMQDSKEKLFAAIVAAPFGALGIRTEPGMVRELVYLPSSYAEKAPTDKLAERAARQVEKYFMEADFRFDLPLAPAGTAFQQKVWKAISAIPRGDVLTYGEVARLVQSAPRAVGQACGANWFPLVVPCHRVTATGGLGGFANHDDETGFHLGVKRWLLAHEGVKGY